MMHRFQNGLLAIFLLVGFMMLSNWFTSQFMTPAKSTAACIPYIKN